MRKLILTAMAATSIAAAHAQKVTDTVSITPGYARQVWYSLPYDEQGNAAKTEWDLGFDVTGFGSTIIINSMTGTTLWAYPKNDVSGWSTVDTGGLSTWTPRYNSDTSWALGAMGRYADPSNPYDLDWGIYSLTTHVITGDSLYIIKLASGDYKKLAIDNLSGGIYSFRYENLDGTGTVSATLDKSKYSNKNFGYYSLQSGKEIDREPTTGNWDILFTQYTAFIPQAYTVTGVLTNKKVSVAKHANLPYKDTYISWSAETYHSEINTIGYDWKAFTGMTYKVQDSLVYFVARANGDIWKMIFTGFEGSATGNFIFSKEKLYTPPPASANNNTANTAGMALYPNPATGASVTLVYNLQGNSAYTKLAVYDVAGRQVMSEELDNTTGLHQHVIPTAKLGKGIYLVSIGTDQDATRQKLIIQ